MLCIHCMFKKIWRTDVTLFLLVLVLFQKNSILEQIKFSEPGYVHVTVQIYCPTLQYNFLHNNLRINTARNCKQIVSFTVKYQPTTNPSLRHYFVVLTKECSWSTYSKKTYYFSKVKKVQVKMNQGTGGICLSWK